MKNSEQLYQELIANCENSSGKFYFVDHATLAGETLRVFSYHIASYTDWLADGALESRGIAFLVDTDGKYIDIASRPPAKFFNDSENPFTMNLDYSLAHIVMDKADGSLISTYKTNNTFGLKSKTSITSEQAVAASRYIKLPENASLYEFAQTCALDNYTVNMEYVAPNNRIVLEYIEPRLIILSIRDNETGDYIQFSDIPSGIISKIKPWLVDEYDPAIAGDVDFIKNIREMKGIEGVVVGLTDSPVEFVKIKTQWYMDLHKTKDSISVPKRLVSTILNNNHDDLYPMFKDDPYTIQRIRAFEQHIVDTVQGDVNDIVRVHKMHKGLDRKFYALKGQTALPQWLFGVYMQQYNGLKDVHSSVIEMYKRRPEMLVPDAYQGDTLVKE